MTARTTLPEIGVEFLRAPALLKQDGEYTDATGAIWAWFAHDYSTGMTPFYTAQQLKEAMEAAWTASRSAALDEAAEIAEEATRRTRQAKAWANTQPIKPCEIAAAIRNRKAQP